MAVVGAVEGLYSLARVVVAEEGADLLHSFLAVVAEVVGDLLCSAIAVEDLRSVAVEVVGDLYNLEEEAMEVEL